MVKIIKPVHKNSISHFSEIGVVKLVSSTVFHSKQVGQTKGESPKNWPNPYVPRV
jgi:hypothetical protein